MSLFRPLVVLGGVGILGVAMVGVGAGVTFTDTTHSLQTITTGSINMNLSSTDPTLAGTGIKTLTLPCLGPVGSTFKTALVPITMTNSGKATAMETSINVSTILPSGYVLADAALMDQMYVCISSPAGPTGAIVYDGLVTGAGLRVLARTVAPDMSDSYSAEFYAGTQTTACTGKSGAATAVATGLDNAAQGGAFTPNVTVSFVQ